MSDSHDSPNPCLHDWLWIKEVHDEKDITFRQCQICGEEERPAMPRGIWKRIAGILKGWFKR